MPLRLGLLLYPAFLFFALRTKKSAPGVLWKAGAVSAETAVRPEGFGISDPRAVADCVRSGVLIRVPGPDGLCFVDPAAYRRRRRRTIAVISVIGVFLAAFAVVMLR
jgi:hypothetical protein